MRRRRRRLERALLICMPNWSWHSPPATTATSYQFGPGTALTVAADYLLAKHAAQVRTGKRPQNAATRIFALWNILMQRAANCRPCQRSCAFHSIPIPIRCQLQIYAQGGQQAMHESQHSTVSTMNSLIPCTAVKLDTYLFTIS